MVSFVKIVADSLCLFCTRTVVYKIQGCIFRIECEKRNVFATSGRTLSETGLVQFRRMLMTLSGAWAAVQDSRQHGLPSRIREAKSASCKTLGCIKKFRFC